MDVIAARQVAMENHLATKARAPSSKQVQRRKIVVLVPIPPTPMLITLPSTGIGTTSPRGEDTQGPLPVDYGLELEANFPLEMVLKMQEGAVWKAQRTVIGRTLGA